MNNMVRLELYIFTWLFLPSRVTFLGLIYGLSALALLLLVLLYKRLSHQQQQLALQNQTKDSNPEANNMAKDNGNAPSAIVKCKEELERETSIWILMWQNQTCSISSYADYMMKIMYSVQFVMGAFLC